MGEKEPATYDRLDVNLFFDMINQGSPQRGPDIVPGDLVLHPRVMPETSVLQQEPDPTPKPELSIAGGSR